MERGCVVLVRGERRHMIWSYMSGQQRANQPGIDKGGSMETWRQFAQRMSHERRVGEVGKQEKQEKVKEWQRVWMEMEMEMEKVRKWT
jgi:hypothetical protein